jgi:hypothetical protein
MTHGDKHRGAGDDGRRKGRGSSLEDRGSDVVQGGPTGIGCHGRLLAY